MCFYICQTHTTCGCITYFCRPYGSRTRFPECYSAHPTRDMANVPINWLQETSNTLCLSCDPDIRAPGHLVDANGRFISLSEPRVQRRFEKEAEDAARKKVEVWLSGLPDPRIEQVCNVAVKWEPGIRRVVGLAQVYPVESLPEVLEAEAEMVVVETPPRERMLAGEGYHTPPETPLCGTLGAK